MARDLDEIGVGWMRRFLRNGWLCVGAAVLALTVMFTVWYQPFRAGYWDVPYMAIPFRTLMGLAFGFVVLAAACLPFEFPSWVNRPLDYLGQISYGIYLWHWLVLLSLQKDRPNPDPKVLFRVLALTMVLAAISWHFMEQPFMQRFRHARLVREPAPDSSRNKAEGRLTPINA